MYKDYRYINAGENEFYRYGRNAQERISAFMTPNKNGFYSIPADGQDYWTFGTSKGKYGEFAKYKDTFFSVNSWGMLWAKEGTEKGEKFVEMLQNMLEEMKKRAHEYSEYCAKNHGAYSEDDNYDEDEEAC